MIGKVSFAALAVLACTAAGAAADNRIRSLAYDPDKIVQILGRAGIQSTIEFAPDERIENVAVGDSSAWQITPNKRASLLFVKPLSARSRTNMTVVTDRRTYMFDLVSGDRLTTPVYALKFNYPNDKPALAVTTASAQGDQAALSAAPAQQPASTIAEKLHFDWQSKGERKLVPTRVFDDGNAVYLSWTRDTPLPAILTMSDDRKEGPLSYKMSGEYIVVSPVPQNMVLRYGGRMAMLWTTRRVATPQPQPIASPPVNVAQRMAALPATPVPPAVSQPAAAGSAGGNSTLTVANVTSLYSDKLTDGRQ